MNRLGLSIVGAVSIIALLFVLLEAGVIHVSDISSAIPPALITAFVGVLVWGIAPTVGRYLRRNQQNTTGGVPSRKRSGWYSRLIRRAPVKKEKRREFWEMVVMMSFMGAMTIGISLSFSSTTLQPARIFEFLVVKYAMTGVGIVVLIVFAWLGLTELIGMRDARNQLIANKKAVESNFFKDFDTALEAVQEVHERSVKLDMLYRFEPRLDALCKSDYPWNQVKDRVDKVLELIPAKLHAESHLYVQFLAMLVTSLGDRVTDPIKKKWLEELEGMYNDPDYRSDSLPNLLFLLEELHGYSRDYMEKLIDDASANWTPLKFQLLALNINFSKMKEKDPSAYKAVLSYLRRKMDDARKNKKEEAYERLNSIYSSAERQGMPTPSSS